MLAEEHQRAEAGSIWRKSTLSLSFLVHDHSLSRQLSTSLPSSYTFGANCLFWRVQAHHLRWTCSCATGSGFLSRMNICHDVSNRIFSSSSFPLVMTLMTGFETVLFVFFFAVCCVIVGHSETVNSEFSPWKFHMQQHTFQDLILVCNYKLHLLLTGQAHLLVKKKKKKEKVCD